MIHVQHPFPDTVRNPLDSGRHFKNQLVIVMSKYTIVWNSTKAEGVIFKESPDVVNDVLHAAGGQKSNPVSTLADSFRDVYDNHRRKSIQEITIDESKAIPVSVYRGK